MVSRFVRPESWKEDTIGHQAEKCLLKLFHRLGRKIEKATDFEDCRFGIDLWVQFKGQLIPIQLTCESDRGRQGVKAQKARRNGVAFVCLPFYDLSRVLAYPSAAERVVNSLRQQLDDYLSFNGAPTLTRETCLQAERSWVSHNGNTFVPRQRRTA